MAISNLVRHLPAADYSAVLVDIRQNPSPFDKEKKVSVCFSFKIYERIGKDGKKTKVDGDAEIELRADAWKNESGDAKIKPDTKLGDICYWLGGGAPIVSWSDHKDVSCVLTLADYRSEDDVDEPVKSKIVAIDKIPIKSRKKKS